VTPNNGNGQAVPGSKLQFTATGHYQDGTSSVITNSTSLSWTSSDTTLATVCGANVGTCTNPGLASAIKTGSPTIIATDLTTGTIKGSAVLTITPAALTSLTIATSTTTLPAGGTSVQLTASGTYSDGTTKSVDPASIVWGSDNTAAVTVCNAAPAPAGSNCTTTPTKPGLATSHAAGAANITAASGGVTSNSLTITVTSATLSSIAVTPGTKTLTCGTVTGCSPAPTQQYAATGTYSDGSSFDITGLVVWASSSTSVATISSSGLATAKPQLGSAPTTISAKLNGISGTATLTVSGP
jgi:hypothetical protein